MPPAVLNLTTRLAAAGCRPALALLAAIHFAAFAICIWFEAEPAAQAAFALTWGLLNFIWLTLLRRPLTSGALSLAVIVVLILLSQFKHDVLLMTATFVDLLIIDVASFSFLLSIIPCLAWTVGLSVALAMPVLAFLWPGSCRSPSA